MQANNSYKFSIISSSLIAIAVFNIASQAWDAFGLATVGWKISGIFTVLSAWGIPMFIAGIGLCYLSDDIPLSNRHNYTKRLPRAMISCIVWWIISALVYLKYNHASELDTDTFFDCMSKVLDTPFNIRLLQLVVVFFAFYPLLKRIAENKKITKYAVVIFFVFSCALPAIRVIPFVNLVNLFTDQINWGFFTSFGLYLFLGLFLSKTNFQWHQRIVIYCLGILSTVAMFSCTAFLSTENIGFDNRFVVEQSPFVAMQVSAIIVFFKTTSEKRVRFSDHAITKQISYAAYVFIPLFSITQNLIGYVISMEGIPLVALIPISALACFISSVGISALLRKTPVLSYFS